MISFIGTICLVGVVVGGVAAGLTGRLGVLCAAAGAGVVAVGTLAWGFVGRQFRLDVVAAHTEYAQPAPQRLAGLWASPEGSLLLWLVVVLATAVGCLAWLSWRSSSGEFTAVVGSRVAVVTRWLGALTAALGVTLLLWVTPFAQSEVPPLDGTGLVPVLRHPMLLVHPPLLYLAQGLVVAAALVAWAGGPAAGMSRTGRSLVAGSAAALAGASMLGAWWAHDELGWGGWWAWDPVENTALAPLVASVAALHARSVGARIRWQFVAVSLVVGGVSMARSGIPESVHAFASGGQAAAILAVAAVAAVAVIVRPGIAGASAPASSVPRWAELTVGVAAGWVLAVVLCASLVTMWFGITDRPAVVDGQLLGTLLIPSGVAFAAGTLAAGWYRNAAAASAHLGVVVMTVGVIGGGFNSAGEAVVEWGVPATVNDRTVVAHNSEQLVDAPVDTTTVVVELEVDGVRVAPSVISHTDSGVVRARPGSGPIRAGGHRGPGVVRRRRHRSARDSRPAGAAVHLDRLDAGGGGVGLLGGSALLPFPLGFQQRLQPLWLGGCGGLGRGRRVNDPSGRRRRG